MGLKIAYVLAEGVKNSDIVGTQAVLGISKYDFYYVAKEIGPVNGDNAYAIKSNTTFEQCTDLDVLIIPSMPEEALEDKALIDFIKKQDKVCKYVVGIGSGLLALGKAGVMKGKHATTRSDLLETLSSYGMIPVDKDSFMKDGKYISAGPSTAAIEAAYYLSYLLRGKAITEMLELNLEYNPTSKYRYMNQLTLPDREYHTLKIAVTCPPNLYLPDIAGAVEVFSHIPNAEIFFVWKDIGERPSILGPTVYSTTTFDDCPQMDVLITGAITPKDTVDPELIDFYKKQSREAKAVVGVCAGVFVLGAAGLLENRMAVTNLHMLKMLKQVGAKRHNTETAFDGKFFTAGPAIGSYEIAIQVVAQLYGNEIAAYIEQTVLEYRPVPLFDRGTPRKAGRMRHGLSLLISTPLTWLYGPKVKRMYKRRT